MDFEPRKKYHFFPQGFKDCLKITWDPKHENEIVVEEYNFIIISKVSL